MIQSILFDKTKNTLVECKKWLREHKYKINTKPKNFDSTNFYRFRQMPPNENYKYRIKTIDHKKNILFVMAY